MAYYLRRAATTYFRNNTRLASQHTSAGEHGDWRLWRKLSFFVGGPAIALGMINAYLGHQEQSHEPPEFIPYDYLRIRTKRFPWGDGQKSFFHNPHVNPLPSGYEDH